MAFPDEIDNTMREAFVICPSKFQLAHIEGLAREVESIHTHAGGAMAAGLEAARRAYWERGQDHAQAVVTGQDALRAAFGDFDVPVRSYKTADTMAEALAYYFDIWPFAADSAPPDMVAGKAQAEWWFRHPIPGTTHPDHGGPIYYAGRSDFIPNMGGLLGIGDDKTASSLGESWMRQWELDSQFTGYTWARRLEGHTCEYVLVRGVSILKPKYAFLLDANGHDLDSKGRPGRLVYNRQDSFGHSQALIYRPGWMVDRWLKQLQRDVARMVDCYINNTWDLALHKGACEAYGGCPYRDLHLVQDPERWQEVNFVRRKWNPLAHV